jgi:microsomal dipeptidase-like Zn-dependent dipeptidase
MKMRSLRRWLVIGAAIAALRLALRGIAWQVQQRLNPVLGMPPYAVSSAAADLHRQLLIADLHADPLLWEMDLLRRNRRGHVDIPRLQEANVALQVFGVVTKVPRPERDATFGQGRDLITLLSAVELWPVPAWLSLTERALYQARKLRRIERRSEGRFRVITSGADLRDCLRRRESNQRLVGGILMLEGAHALQGSMGNVDRLYDAGFRMVSLTHLFDNDTGGSSLGVEQYGLTSFGRALVKRLEETGFIIDLAHASRALFDDLLAATTRPILVSHTGVQGVCPNARNLTDELIREVASRGGIIGIGFDALFTCESGIQPIAESIRHVADLVGVAHVALGSDFDGAIRPPFDVTGLPLLTEELLKQGCSAGEIRQIMGGNAIRFLEENLL